ncbi:hypothetical protein ACVW1A_006439 [Bradyrhizobium sp. LB1.3]|uniref:hypothetical protein n=1 Tax=Bradyrhizobium sp. LB14.3 TaxID=3156328 RepID=UPI0033996ECA
MRELFDIIRTNPWPFGAGLFVVILMIIVEKFGRCIRGDGAVSDFSDYDRGCGEGDGD